MNFNVKLVEMSPPVKQYFKAKSQRRKYRNDTLDSISRIQ